MVETLCSSETKGSATTTCTDKTGTLTCYKMTTRAAFGDGLLFTEQGTEQMQDFLWHAKGLPAPCVCICTRDESGFCDTDGGSLEEGGRAWLTNTPTSRRWRGTDRPAPGTKAGRRRDFL